MAAAIAEASSRLWAPVRLTSFRLLWLGQSLSLLGDSFSYVAFSWITLSLTDSTLTLGFVLALQAVPRAALTLVGGSLSDRWSPRRLMVFSSWARAVVMTAVAVIGLSGLLDVWMLLTAAAFFGAVDAFFRPARSSILPSVVDEELLAPANALLGVGSRVSAVMGPAAGGLVVAVSDAGYAFLVDGVCFALCGLCVSRVRPLKPATDPVAAPTPVPVPTAVPAEAGEPADTRPRHAETGPESGAPAEPQTVPVPEPGPEPGPEPAQKDTLVLRIKEGLSIAWADPRIRTMLAIDTAVTFCNAGPFTVGFAYLAKFHLAGGSTSLGLLDGALTGGAMLGALIGGMVGRRLPLGLLIAGLAGWLATGMALLGVTSNLVAAIAVVLTMGFAIGFQGVVGMSWVQRNVHGSVLSRVISVDMVFGYVAAPVSLVLCGALARQQPGWMFGGTALILVLTAVGVLSSRPVRAMR
jgi:MFS family permease